MRKLLVGLVVVAGCWRSSAPTPQSAATEANVIGGSTYGGSAYGGSTYGILGAMAGTQGGGFGSLTGTGDLSSGFDDTNIYGGLIGTDPTDPKSSGLGVGGLGARGTGPGGGGTGWGTIGTGRYGTIGHGSGTGSGYGRGGGAAAPTVRLGAASSAGSLDAAIIRRMVRRNLNKIRYCYEKELLRDPALLGKVTVRFTIGADGRVSTSTGAGLQAEVDRCVAAVIRAIQFPKPAGGGIVTVTYPFTFAPAAAP